MIVSRRTIVFVVCALALVVGSFVLASAEALEPAAQLALVNLAEPLALALSALMVFWTARHFAPGEPLRRQWMPIGAGLLAFALGDLLYAAVELASGAPPASPGLVELLYALFYPLVCAGILQAALGYRRMLRLAPLVAVAASVGVLLLAAAAVPFLRAAPSALSASRESLWVDLLFAVADVAFVVVPAVLVLLIAAKMRGARLAMPWVAVALGGVVFAISDMWFLYQQWAGTYRGGAVTDLGWMVGGVLIATGASLAADVNLVRRREAFVRPDASARPSAANPTA